MSLRSSLLCMRIVLNLDVLYSETAQKGNQTSHGEWGELGTRFWGAEHSCGKRNSRELRQLGRVENRPACFWEGEPPATPESGATVGPVNSHVADTSYFDSDVSSCWGWVQLFLDWQTVLEIEFTKARLTLLCVKINDTWLRVEHSCHVWRFFPLSAAAPDRAWGPPQNAPCGISYHRTPRLCCRHTKCVGEKWVSPSYEAVCLVLAKFNFAHRWKKDIISPPWRDAER